MHCRRNYIDLIVLLVSITVLSKDLQQCEGNPFPFLNLVNRVNRGPSVRSTEDELDGSSALSSSGRLAFLKSPAFHMRFRPNRYAHLHSPLNNHNFPSLAAAAMSAGQGGDSPDLHKNDDRKNYSNSREEGGSAAAFVGGFGRIGEVEDKEAVSGLGSEEPTFTPFISARALSNMEEFFKHLRENLVAIQQDESGDGSSDSDMEPPERRRIVHSGPSDESLNLHPQADAPDTDGEPDEVSNHDYNFSSSRGSNPLAMALRWQPLATGQFRGAIPSPLSSSRMQTFIQPLTEEEAYRRKANNYNPSWLWTNMGLGRKRRR